MGDDIEADLSALVDELRDEIQELENRLVESVPKDDHDFLCGEYDDLEEKLAEAEGRVKRHIDECNDCALKENHGLGKCVPIEEAERMRMDAHVEWIDKYDDLRAKVGALITYFEREYELSNNIMGRLRALTDTEPSTTDVKCPECGGTEFHSKPPSGSVMCSGCGYHTSMVSVPEDTQGK